MEQRAQLYAGYAVADITPPVGTEMTGFIAREGPSIGVRDPLEARALVFKDAAGHHAALVACDLIGLGRHLVARVRHSIGELAGLAPEAILLSCSHTHSGPETGVLTTIAEPSLAYLAELESRLVEVVVAAARRLEPVALAIGETQVPDGLAINRVYRRIGRPDAYDRQLIVVRLERAGSAASEAPLATMVGFACHAVALGAAERELSADFVAPLRRELEAAGTGPVLYINGCGGDVNPASMDARGREACDALGHGLAQAALIALGQAQPVAANGGVAAASEWVPLPYQALRSAEQAAAILAAGREQLARHPAGSAASRIAQITEVDYALRLVRLHYGSEPLPEVQAEVQALRLGPLAVVALPGEIFSSLGRAIKQVSPFPPPRTLVAGWSNDNVGYVPDRDAYALGGYEVDTASRYYGHPAGWAPEAGDALVASAQRVLVRLQAEGAPSSQAL